MSPIAPQVHAVRAALVRALMQAEVSGISILTAGIPDFHPLNWFAPAIYPYTDIGEQLPTAFAGFGMLKHNGLVGPLQQVYDLTMWHLRYSPEEALSDCRTYLKMPAQAFFLEEEAKLVFTAPNIVGGDTGDEAGYTFALEFVAACVSAGYGALTSGGDDFYIQDHKLYAGVKGGRVIMPSSVKWGIDVSGYVEAHLTMTRGAGWTTHTLDIIDRIAFWYEGLTDLLPGLDALPETLSFLKGGCTASDLRLLESALLGLDQRVAKLQDRKRVTRKQLKPNEYFRRLDDCEGFMQDWRMTDQERIMKLFELLVPDILSEKAFISRIFDLNRPANTLKAAEVRKINGQLFKLKHQPKNNA